MGADDLQGQLAEQREQRRQLRQIHLENLLAMGHLFEIEKATQKRRMTILNLDKEVMERLDQVGEVRQ